eukprot:jgi/Hompol1/634/HPOL_004247-RA
MVEYAHPPFPSCSHTRRSTDSTDTKFAVELPDEWSFMTSICLLSHPGSHILRQRYLDLPAFAKSMLKCSTLTNTSIFCLCPSAILTLWSMSQDLINKTADVTRTKVQKAVVVLATQPVLGSIRSKLGLVTQAFFAQRDFTKIEILDTLYENLDASVRMPFTDATLHMGISLRELIYKFRQKTLQLVKLLLLGKRILFFGQKVERLSAYQYGLISLIPELLRHLEDVGSPAIDNVDVRRTAPAQRKVSLNSSTRSMQLLRQHNSDSHKSKLGQLGHPLRLFGEGAFFQPYIPLQQIDVLMSPQTKSFLVGTSNAIFTHHKACAIDAVAYVSYISLSSPRFPKIDYEGSDEDIRARFESYLVQMLASINYDNQAAAAGKTDYLSEYNMAFVKCWESTRSYKLWKSVVDQDALSMVNPGHPFHGYSALGEMSLHFSARVMELSKGMTPLQTNLSKAFSATPSTETGAAGADSATHQQPQNLQGNTSHFIAKMPETMAARGETKTTDLESEII